MSWLLRLLTFGSGGVRDPSARTLEAAYQRQSAVLQDARRTVVEMLGAEKQLSAAAETLSREDWTSRRIAALRAQRLMLESASEKLRLRVDLFRTEKLAVGTQYVGSGAFSRSGETLATLVREAAEITQVVERAKETLREIQSESR
jgi:phage shock protein A